MIVDSHCHAWSYWPYEPKVPDPESKGTVEQLIWEMDHNGVEQACIVAAQIEHNPDNNDYVAAKLREYPNRLHLFADVDSVWSDTYHKLGAVERLEAAIKRWPMRGVTHYLADDDGSWLTSDQGMEWFAAIAENKLIASIACQPQHQPALRKVAEKYPTMPILCHHMSSLHSSLQPDSRPVREVLESAAMPNIHLKFSGFHYLGERGWDYPNFDTHWIYRLCYEHFGVRMCWGSDFPACLRYVMYKHSLEAFRTYCSFIPEKAKADILGATMGKLLEGSRQVRL